MALKSGLGVQFGFAPEVTYGLPVAPSSWLPLKGETLGLVRSRIESAAIFANRKLLVSGMWTDDVDKVSGDLELDLYNRGLGYLFQAIFGAPVTTGAGPYTHTYTPGDLTGKSLTGQIGIPTTAGVVVPFNYAGAKVGKAELSCAAGELAKLKLSLVGQTEHVTRVVSDGVLNSTTTVTSATAAFAADDIGKPISGGSIPAAATIVSVTNATTVIISAAATTTVSAQTITIGLPLGTPSYPATIKPLGFRQGSITLGGSTVKVKQFTLSIDNGLDDSRGKIGQGYVDEPLEKQMMTVDGSLELDFVDITQYRRYLQAAEVALVLSFVNGTDSVTFTLNVRIDGDTPDASGPQIVPNMVKFKADGTLAGGDSTAVTCVLVNSDATP